MIATKAPALVKIISKSNAGAERKEIGYYVMYAKNADAKGKNTITDDGGNATGDEKTLELNNTLHAQKLTQLCFK